MYHDNLKRFFDPRYVLDGRIGKDSLRLFRTPVQTGTRSLWRAVALSRRHLSPRPAESDCRAHLVHSWVTCRNACSGTLRFELGVARQAHRLHINWWRYRARKWELWIDRGAGGQATAAGGRRLRTGRWEKWTECTASACEVDGEGNSDTDYVDLRGTFGRPLLVERFQIRLFGVDEEGRGIAIDEVQLFGLTDVELAATGFENTVPVQLFADVWKVGVFFWMTLTMAGPKALFICAGDIGNTRDPGVTSGCESCRPSGARAMAAPGAERSCCRP